MGLNIDLSHNKAVVNRYIVAEFARQCYGENQYYQVLLKDDPVIQAVLKR
jgi:carboxyl-terminal processing protease